MTTSGSTSNAAKTFARPQQGRVLTGAASAVARQLGVDVLLVRLIWLAAVLAGGFGVLAYVLVSVFAPEVNERGEVVSSTVLKPAALLLVGLMLGVVVLAALAAIYTA